MKSTTSKTSDALKILDRITGVDSDLREAIEEATLNAQVAELIYATRRQAGLTQKQLAALIGSTQPVIARLENADYVGHSLTMLRRIGETLQLRLELRFVPRTEMSETVEQPGTTRKKERVVSAVAPPRRSRSLQEKVSDGEGGQGGRRGAAPKGKGRRVRPR